MSVSPAIIDRLLAIDAVSNLVEARVARQRAISNWERPFIVVHNEDEEAEYSASGRIYPAETRITIAMFCDDVAHADQIQSAIMDQEGTFNTKEWVTGNVQVDHAFVENVDYSVAPEIAGASYGNFLRSLFVGVHWRPTA